MLRLGVILLEVPSVRGNLINMRLPYRTVALELDHNNAGASEQDNIWPPPALTRQLIRKKGKRA